MERLLGKSSCDAAGAKSSKPLASKLDMFFWAGFRLWEAALSSRRSSSAQIAPGARAAGTGAQDVSGLMPSARGVLNIAAGCVAQLGSGCKTLAPLRPIDFAARCVAQRFVLTP